MEVSNKKGILALSPLIVFIVLYLAMSIIAGDFYKVPITVAFMIASIYAITISGGFPLAKRIDIFSRGAGSSTLLLMLWIYVLAGAFAESAKQMGSIDATVNLALHVLPDSLLLPGLFLAACFISISIGTSVGTVVALVPIAAGIAHSTDADIALVTAIIVGGAYFGDNLSFISDTTVVATQTQGCKMSDKFRANLLIVMPGALAILIIYAFMGADIQAPGKVPDIEFIKVIPYLVVLLTAVFGMNVMAVLAIGIALCGIIGIANGTYDIYGWFGAMGKGITGMGELVIIAMLAGGMLEIIREGGGIDYLIAKLTSHVTSKRGAEFSIAVLVGLVNVCTANNTVAILTVGSISKKIGDKFGVDKRKAASILDTFSCAVQGMLPYGVQLLLAAGLAGVNPILILPYLYYPMAIGFSTLLAILLRYPKRYS
ncbi:Na+/H+ antiporter NhaC family protein [Prevotella sp. kh1p2]|uniref:Na+/H+ antiporter NhaC family protein n=1 Tax=Prevotella sp. kh1p2 TaxID=1761883 RepID=UPI0008D4A347|nr:Na+/H+ antiporter NhaC family protein [Prevotella sp. kh1p2]SET14107.1 Na+/H+ antiporter NhaC [Prevotella sp. kh1p2]SNU12012.1 Na+/H+ antiporter NhaC [Prevotellaceae bacterium KH2P17]